MLPRFMQAGCHPGKALLSRIFRDCERVSAAERDLVVENLSAARDIDHFLTAPGSDGSARASQNQQNCLA